MHTSHTNVLELIAVNIDPQSGALSMISELMENGNIMDYIRANEANRICLVRNFRLRLFCELNAPKLNDVINGLSYLHKCKIIHGDLKGVGSLWWPLRWRERGSIYLTRYHSVSDKYPDQEWGESSGLYF